MSESSFQKAHFWHLFLSHLAAPNANTTSFLRALWDQCFIETRHVFLFTRSFPPLFLVLAYLNRRLKTQIDHCFFEFLFFFWVGLGCFDLEDEYKTLGEQNVDVKGEVQYTATDFSVGTKHPGAAAAETKEKCGSQR